MAFGETLLQSHLWLFSYGYYIICIVQFEYIVARNYKWWRYHQWIFLYEFFMWMCQNFLLAQMVVSVNNERTREKVTKLMEKLCTTYFMYAKACGCDLRGVSADR